MQSVSLSRTFTHFCSEIEPGHYRVCEKIRLSVVSYETRPAWWQWLWHKPATHTGRYSRHIQRQANATAERSSTFLPPQGTQPPFMLWFAPHKANFLPMPMALCCPFPWISNLSFLHESSWREGQPTGHVQGQYRKYRFLTRSLLIWRDKNVITSYKK